MASDGIVQQPLIPRGYYFIPTEEDLLLHYLLRKSRDQPLDCNAVIDKQIYGDIDMEPWKIFGDETKSSQKFYIFTKLKKKGMGRKNMERKAGCGTWKHQRTDPVKDYCNNVIGLKKLLVFQVKGSRNSTTSNNGHWLMHEFSLPDDYQSDYVLCVIRNKRAIDISDDQPQKKRVKLSSSASEEQDSFMKAAKTPVASTTTSSTTTNGIIAATAPKHNEECITEELGELDLKEFITDLLAVDEDATPLGALNDPIQATYTNDSFQATNAHFINDVGLFPVSNYCF